MKSKIKNPGTSFSSRVMESLDFICMSISDQDIIDTTKSDNDTNKLATYLHSVIIGVE